MVGRIYHILSSLHQTKKQEIYILQVPWIFVLSQGLRQHRSQKHLLVFPTIVQECWGHEVYQAFLFFLLVYFP